MSQKPPLIPDDARTTQQSPTVKRSRHLERLLWLVILLFLISLGGIATLVLYNPGVLGLESQANLTQTAAQIEQTALVLQDTAVALNNRNFDIDNTSAALDNRADLLQQQETQSARDYNATVTAVAVANARQGTQAALDFRSTQVAFVQEATRVELEYRGTQAALNRDATAVALGFATQAPSANNALSQTPSPTITQAPLFEDGFSSGVSGGLWRLGDVADWRIADDETVSAQRSGAWLLTQLGDLTDYVLELDLIPLTGDSVSADYFVLVSVPGGRDGLTLRLSYNGERLTAVGLYRFTIDQFFDENGLLGEPLQAVQAQQVQSAPSESLQIRLEVRDTHLVAVINGSLVLDTMLDQPLTPGAVGVQVPQGGRIARIALLP